MTDAVLHVHTQFGKRLAAAFFGTEYGVVAETLGSALSFCNATIHDALKEMLLASFVDVGNGGAEAGVAVVLACQFCEQLACIGFGVLAVGIGIACRMHARAAAEGFHFKSRVVGKAGQGVAFVHVARLE